jgi:hypothetical protein
MNGAHVQTSEDYLVPIVEKLLDHALFHLQASMATVRLWVRCPSVTLREMNGALATWRQRDRRLSVVNEWVVHHAANFDLDENGVAEELFSQLSGRRKAKLEEAASAVAESGVNACVEMALECLELQAVLFRDGLGCLGPRFYRMSRAGSP